jgi:4-hydroxy-tetrahydrodipicolinate synthase
MVTPLLDRSRLDREGLERLIEHILAGAVSGLFILGTTGEAPGLSHVLRRDLVNSACALVRKRVPVLVGITDTCFAESVELAAIARQAGASAVVASAPYYFKLSQTELLGYVNRLAAELPLPLFLYNMPALTKLSFAPETVARVAELDGVVGFKDSSEDMAYFEQVCRLLRGKQDFSLFMGPETLLVPALQLGAHGGVCGGANICPGLFVDLYRAAVAGDNVEVARLHGLVTALGDQIYHVSESESGYFRGLKCALSWLGICGGTLAEPYESFESADSARVRQALVKLGLLPQQAPLL